MKDNFFKQLQKIETLAKSGNFVDAIQLLKKLIRKKPADPNLLSYLGKIYFFKGEIENAENYLNKAFQIDSNSFEINFNLGNLNARLSRHDKAINFYKNSLRVNEGNEHIFNNIGASYLALNDYENAINYFRNALEINKTFHHALLNLGQSIYQLTYSEFKKMKLIQNNEIEGLENTLEMIDEGISALELLTNLNPSAFEGHRYLGLLKQLIGDINSSEIHLIEAIKMNRNREDLKALAKSYHYESQQLNKAADIYDVLIQLSIKENGKFEFISKKIEVMFAMNRKEVAFKLFKNHIKDFSDLDLVSIFGYFTKQLTNDEISLIRESIENIIQNETDKQIVSKAYFEKARLYLHEDKVDQYIQNLNHSKKIREEYIEKEKSYLSSLYEMNLNKIEARLSFLNKMKLENIDSNFKPIFVIGMPRSGTTLIEMILSSHSKVAGCGEVSFLKEKIDLFKGSLKKNNLSTDKVKKLFTKLRDNYILYVSARMENKVGYFVDKLPGNSEIIDILKIMFPQAKFIYSNRDDMANAWSIYSNHFGNNIAWVNSMQKIVDYKKNVREFIRKAEKELQIKMLYQDYFDLVTSPEKAIRKLLDFCELNFDERCLRPEKNDKSILTLSIEQARQPIYKGSDDKWKKFDKYLDVFKKEFLN